MSRRTKLGIIGVVVTVVVVGIFALSAAKRGSRGTEVRYEEVNKRDLVATVTASGNIEAKTKVDISSDITGRITRIAVREGEDVKKGEFLIQIDPAQYEAAVARAEALLATGQAAMVQAKANMDQSERAVQRARSLKAAGNTLISDEDVELAQTSYDVAVANYNASRAQVEQYRASLQEARDQLGKTRLVSPMDGRVVRLAVEEGEVAVPGTFSRETGLLMTVADLSVILATIKVDETDVIRLQMGDSVEVTIDAYPDTSFVGRVTKISNSALLTPTQTAAGSSDRAVDFEVEITLTNPPPDIRPDLSCTARIITDIRDQALSIPIIALTVRQHEVVPNESVDRDTTGAGKKKDTEGVFVVHDDVAQFVPVKVGVAGEEHFEVLEGLREGDTIVAGPYQAIRDMKDSTKVRNAAPSTPSAE